MPEYEEQGYTPSFYKPHITALAQKNKNKKKTKHSLISSFKGLRQQ